MPLLVVCVVVPVSAAPPAEIATETEIPFVVSGLPAPSRTCTAGAALNAVPLTTLDGGCVDIVSCAGAPAAKAMVAELTLGSPAALNVSV